MREWQVEYMSRPAEHNHVQPCQDFREACLLARQMSEKHDGTAFVVALDDMPDNEEGKVATGHIAFTFGILGERVGCLSAVDVPRARSL